MATRSASVGVRAPDFSLPSTQGAASTRRTVALDDFLERWLILLFYPRDFSVVCPTELAAVSARIAEFQERGCAVLGVSTDSIETHERWLTASLAQGGLGGLNFPLASDESGSICQAYGVYVPRQHLALRGLFVIDPNGVLQYQVVHSLSVGRNAEEVLRVVDALQMGGLCAADWQPGKGTIDLAAELGPGRVLGPYHILAKLGGGAFGAVFRALDSTLEREVALKVLHQRDGSTQSLLAEARAAAALNHPNVCTIHAVDTTLGAPMIVMEYVEGQPLSTLLTAGAMPAAKAVDLAGQVAHGMAAAHAQAVVHGDLKPANILVSASGVAKIVDFGLARRQEARPADATLTVQNVPGISGTLAYMSPEQARGEPALPASDVFALGLILYEMLTGHPTRHEQRLLQLLRTIESTDPEEYATQVPAPFAELIRRALLPDARRRITMREMAEQLAGMAAG